MPIYEYVCQDCHHRFEVIRNIRNADSPMTCESCAGSLVKRLLSHIAARTNDDQQIHIQSTRSGCGGCSKNSCAGCTR